MEKRSRSSGARNQKPQILMDVERFSHSVPSHICMVFSCLKCALEQYPDRTNAQAQESSRDGMYVVLSEVV